MGKPKRPREGDTAASMDKGTGGGSGGVGGGRNRQKRRKRDNNRDPDMIVKITRVEITDDYVHAPAPLSTTAASSAGDIGQDSYVEQKRVSSSTVAKTEKPNKEPKIDGNAEQDSETSDGTKDEQMQASTREDAKDTAQSHSMEQNAKMSASAKGEQQQASAIGNDINTAQSEQKEKEETKEREEPTEHTSANATSNDPKKPRQPYIKIITAKSAKRKPMFKHENFDRNYKPLPDGDCGDGIKNPHPKEEVPDKFWAQRRRLFARYDEGIRLDKESWYSVTPEAIADHIARKMAKAAKALKGGNNNGISEGAIVLDAFCGCGGNAVAFAKLPREDISLVVCIDTDRSKLEMAAHNAELYGISRDRIIFIEADAVRIMQYGYNNGSCIINNPTASVPQGKKDTEADSYKIGGLELLPPHIDAVFLSPPWGGMDYCKMGKMGYKIAKHIKLHPCEPEQKKAAETGDNSIACATTTATRGVVNGEELLVIAGNVTANKVVTYFLPRNTNGVALGSAALKAGYRYSIELEQNFLNGKLKTSTAYLSVDN